MDVSPKTDDKFTSQIESKDEFMRIPQAAPRGPENLPKTVPGPFRFPRALPSTYGHLQDLPGAQRFTQKGKTMCCFLRLNPMSKTLLANTIRK